MSPRASSVCSPEAMAYQKAYGITLSSRVRLARNLQGIPFPDKASPAMRAEVRRRVMEAAREALPIQ